MNNPEDHGAATYVFAVQKAMLTPKAITIQLLLTDPSILHSGLKSLLYANRVFDFRVGSGNPVKSFLTKLDFSVISSNEYICSLSIRTQGQSYTLASEISILAVTIKDDEILEMILANPEMAPGWVDLDDFLVAPEPGIFDRGPHWNRPLIEYSFADGTINYATGEVNIPYP